MKSSPQENADLTAYALGELHARQAREIHALLADCPAAIHELEQVEAVTDALRQGAPIPLERLRPEQRHAVLYPASLPRRTGPLVSRPVPRRPSVFKPVMSGLLKAAAVVTLTGAAYIIGRQGITEKGAPSVTAARETPPTPPKQVVSEEAPSVPEYPPVELIASTPVPVVVDSIPSAGLPSLVPPAAEPVVTVALSNSEQTPPATKVPEVETRVLELKTAPVVAKVPRPLPMTTPGKHVEFVSASRHPVDQFALTPSQIRPLPVKLNSKEILAAPAPLKQTSEPRDNSRSRTPDIYIHSWKAEVSTCPWNEAHRLLRVTIQLPADQPAALSKAAYPLRVNFDPINVREYRQLCERHQPAAELRQSGTHVVWYEFVPNGVVDGTRNVATVTLDKGHFTTQTIGPFDGTRLSIQDRGVVWSEAREDFIFDSAVVGFGLLMRGMPGAPQLDHDLVLDLAMKAKGKDADGERARFIKLVNEAAGAAGL